MNQKKCNFSASEACPLPVAEDRFEEALHFMQAIEESDNYHDPRVFRFNLNALLSALRSTSELLDKELEQQQLGSKWRELRVAYKADPDLLAVTRGRNVTLHQKAIFEGSRVFVGLFRGYQLKLATMSDVRHDAHSREILAFWLKSALAPMLLDDERTSVGEQYGVRREYRIAEISKADDVLTACWKAVIRTSDALNDAHRLHGALPIEVPAEMLLDDHRINQVMVLLETDVDPTLPFKWGWANYEYSNEFFSINCSLNRLA